jgi:hypothetical protein
MVSEAEHVDLCFDKAFDQIQFDDVVTILRKHIEIMDISIDHKNSVHSQLEDWCPMCVSEICFLFGFHNMYIPCLPSLGVYDKMTELPVS